MNDVSWPNGITSPDHQVSPFTLDAMWFWHSDALIHNIWFSVSQSNEEER